MAGFSCTPCDKIVKITIFTLLIMTRGDCSQQFQKSLSFVKPLDSCLVYTKSTGSVESKSSKFRPFISIPMISNRLSKTRRHVAHESTERMKQELTEQIKQDLTDKISQDNNDKMVQKKVELWLDLRGTAISPGAALHYLYNDQWSEFESFGWKTTLTSNGNRITHDMVQRILVSKANLSQKSSSDNPEYSDATLLEHIQSLNLIYVDETDSSIFEIQPATSASTLLFQQSPLGRRMSIDLDPSHIPDPILALECLSAHKQWLLIDYPPLVNENQASIDDNVSKERRQKVSDLVNFLAVASSSSSSSSISGCGSNAINDNIENESQDQLLLLNIEDLDTQIQIIDPIDLSSTQSQKVDEIQEDSGVAITCRTRNDLLQAAASLQLYQFHTENNLCEEMSDGGIAIISTSSSIISDPMEKKSTAIVLPFDMSIWKTAALLFGQAEDE